MLKKAEDEKAVLTALSPSNRMFEDKENQRPTLVTDTAETNHKNFTFPNIIPDQKGFGTNLKPAEKKSRAPKGTDENWNPSYLIWTNT
jgi:hypothetical protein